MLPSVPSYLLFAPVNVGTIFVALPTQSRRSPVAIGSSVPVCPTFLTPYDRLNRFLSLLHTSNDVHPCGLSTSTRQPPPYGAASRLLGSARPRSRNGKQMGFSDSSVGGRDDGFRSGDDDGEAVVPR